jgi:hypothetical protein
MIEKVTVSAAFRRNFEIFAEHRVSSGFFTDEEMEGLRELIRKDLRPGPDQIRAEVDCLEIAGVKIPATIDDVADRYRLWDEFFAAEVEALELANMMANHGRSA